MYLFLLIVQIVAAELYQIHYFGTAQLEYILTGNYTNYHLEITYTDQHRYTGSYSTEQLKAVLSRFDMDLRLLPDIIQTKPNCKTIYRPHESDREYYSFRYDIKWQMPWQGNIQMMHNIIDFQTMREYREYDYADIVRMALKEMHANCLNK